jgi:uncharacterized membrane protein
VDREDAGFKEVFGYVTRGVGFAFVSSVSVLVTPAKHAHIQRNKMKSEKIGRDELRKMVVRYVAEYCISVLGAYFVIGMLRCMSEATERLAHLRSWIGLCGFRIICALCTISVLYRRGIYDRLIFNTLPHFF